MFGIDSTEIVNLTAEELALLKLLSREVSFNPLPALISAIKAEAANEPLSSTAIGIDANVFLRISSHRKSADIIDYFSSAHTAPLILPGQAIQEFWNNQLSAVTTISAGLRKSIDSLKNEISKINDDFGDYANKFDELLTGFHEAHGNVYDEATVRKTILLLEALLTKSIVPHASRSVFSSVAYQRKRNKTPPGFKDEGDGDFFIWADFLTGLQQARSGGGSFTRAVMISLDKKPDWSREGTAHPILTAEVRSLFAVPFEIWNIDRLAEEITSSA